jgi:dynein heavy chain
MLNSSSFFDFKVDIERTSEVADMRADLEERVQTVMNLAYEYTQKFEPYSYLWEDDRAEFLEQFLKYGHQLTSDELDAKSVGEVTNHMCLC